MAEPIRPKCVVTPGKVYGCSELQNLVFNNFDFFLNFKTTEQLFYIVQR